MQRIPTLTGQKAIQRIAGSADRRIAWEFFVLFSRLEYALKRAGYLKHGKVEAQADWRRFARNFQDDFSQINNEPVTGAKYYYETRPPRKQLQQDGELHWGEPLRRGDGELELEFLCRSIGVVRNNLFHGGKFPQLPVPEPSRDQELLRHAKELLFAVLELNVDVRRHFFEGIDET